MPGSDTVQAHVLDLPLRPLAGLTQMEKPRLDIIPEHELMSFGSAWDPLPMHVALEPMISEDKVTDFVSLLGTRTLIAFVKDRQISQARAIDSSARSYLLPVQPRTRTQATFVKQLRSEGANLGMQAPCFLEK